MRRLVAAVRVILCFGCGFDFLFVLIYCWFGFKYLVVCVKDLWCFELRGLRF